MMAFENLYRDQFALSTHLRELSFLVINNSLFLTRVQEVSYSAYL